MTETREAGGNPAVRPAAPPKMGLFGLVGVIFFCVCGGAFGLEDAVGSTGPLWALAGILLVPVLYGLPIALMTAELATAIPEDGGHVVWVDRAFGRFWSFQNGWWSWTAAFFDNALYPVLFISYLKFLIPDLSGAAFWAVGSAVVIVFAALNIRGTQLVGAASAVFTVLVLSPFVIMVALGIGHLQPGAWTARTVHAPGAAISTLLTVLMWNYSGWDAAGTCAGQVNNPARTYPRALFVSTVVIALTYLLPVLVGASVSQEWDKWTAGYFSDVATKVGGPWLGTWMSICGLFSAMGLFNALLLASSYVPEAMAKQGTFPKPFGWIHPRYGTPWFSILVNAVGCLLLMGWANGASDSEGPFAALLKVDILLYSFRLTLTFLALIRLRKSEPGLERPYRIPGGIAGVVAITIPPTLLALAALFLSPRMTQVALAVVIAAGLGIYAAGAAVRRVKKQAI